MAAPAASGSLEGAQLARARPPDSLWLRHLQLLSRGYVDSEARAHQLFAPMCRLFGCVAREPISVRHDLLEAENPLIHQSEEHDSGWGMAVYKQAEGENPRCMRFPEAAHQHDEFVEATGLTGRMFNIHVRRATVGGLAPENTHPFCLGPYSFCHNGTIMRPHKLLEPGMREPAGQTDSEVFFTFVPRAFPPDPARRSLRKDIRAIIERSAFSGLNFLFTDGEKLYAYKLGVFDLYW